VVTECEVGTLVRDGWGGASLNGETLSAGFEILGPIRSLSVASGIVDVAKA
jgi:hypothetical protein